MPELHASEPERQPAAPPKAHPTQVQECGADRELARRRWLVPTCPPPV